VKQRVRYYLFPRDAYFVPSSRRLVDLLETMDRDMDLGLQVGGTFEGSFRERASEESEEERVLEVTSFQDFVMESGDLSGELREIQVSLGRPGRELLRDLETEKIEIRGHPSLVMVDLTGVEQARLVCPSCGERHALEGSAQPDPRFYCFQCGGLTPLPDTQLAVEGTDEPLSFPCYRFTILFHGEQEAGLAEHALAPSSSFMGMEALEGSLGCGLRAILVRSAGP